MKLLITLLASVSLAACGTIANIQHQQVVKGAKEEREKAVAACEQMYPRRPALPRVRCLMDTAEQFSVRVGDPHIDLGRQLSARLILTAERLDKGQISEAQMDVERTSAVVDYENSIRRRINDATMANAAMAQARAAYMPTTCTKTGNSVTCF